MLYSYFGVAELLPLILSTNVQGDPSGLSKPVVDIDVKVAFWYEDLILKRNFQINVNNRF